MFASRTILEHVVRGALGLAAFAFATLLMPTAPLVAVPLFVLALAALRGCPICWTIGLAQTVLARLRGRSPDDACTDGRCALRDPSTRAPTPHER